MQMSIFKFCIFIRDGNCMDEFLRYVLRKKTAIRCRSEPEVESRTRGQGCRPSRGLEPRIQAQVFSKKKVFKIFFRRSRQKKFFKNVFQAKKVFKKYFFRRSPLEENKKGLRKVSARFRAFSYKISMVQKLVVYSSRRQGNFRGLEASSTSKCVLEDSTSDQHYGNPVNHKKYNKSQNHKV